MDFEQLRAFLEVAKHSSFSRAAEKLFRTQPAISAQIRTLEEEVGARLFDRTGGRVTLTDSGKLFMGFAEQAQQSRRAVIRSVAELERTPRGELMVSANEATCLYILPHVFAQFKLRCPHVSVSVSRFERGRTLEAVLDQEVDFGVVSLPVNDPRLNVKTIHHDELAVILHPQHPLAGRSHISLEEIAQHPLLLPLRGRSRDAVDQAFFRHQINPKISMELESSELLKRFVAAGVGIGFLPRYAAELDVRAGLISIASLEGITIQRDLGIVYRKDKNLSRAATVFLDITLGDRNTASNPHADLLAAAAVAGDES